MIGPITGSVAENESFPTWSQDPRIPAAISRHWRRWLSSASSTAVEVPRDRVLMGSSGFAFDDQAMIAHVTSPFTDKIAPYRSNPHPPILALSLFLLPLFSSFSSSFARFETCIRAGTCGDRAASREFNNCRSSRSRVNAVPRAQSFYERLDISRIYIYVYTYTCADKGSFVSQVKRAIAHSPVDWDSENYDAVPRSSRKIFLRNLIVKIGEKCRD